MHILKEMSNEQRPYERCKKYGPQSLTDAELLAIILRTGSRGMDVLTMSQNILNMPGPKPGLCSLMHRDYHELSKIKGIGAVKAMQLLCIGEIAKRLWRRETAARKLYFTRPELCATYYMQEMRYLEREELRLVFLDTKQRMMEDCILSRGTVSSSLISVREVLIETLKRQAVNVIMIHNHPSGNPTPSEEDVRITKRMAMAFQAVGIGFNDHIIIGDNTYYSFREHGGDLDT